MSSFQNQSGTNQFNRIKTSSLFSLTFPLGPNSAGTGSFVGNNSLSGN